ncbi:hypothetical protein [Halolamina sediminis]|uniref:hypothetical protein n=1 Tax=Halolamina sediminis TaxID=1480675 RepID=UPI0006B5C64D|nr:hypothetical protein [Halolamina sediminis]
MSRSTGLPTRVTLAFVGATAVVAAELAAIALSVGLSAAAVGPDSASPLPVAAVSLAAVGLVLAVRRRAGEKASLAVSGVVLVVAAPVTAFGGGCGLADRGVGVFRSGVRIGVTVGDCVTFSNGALLVLGYALLSAGLWLAADELCVGRFWIPGRPD